MSLIYKLLCHKEWKNFLSHKLDKEFINDSEKMYFKDFINKRKYLAISLKIVFFDYKFSIPKKHILNKANSTKKRIVYNYNDKEMMILKFLSFLLYKYDYLFSPNVYSFRKNSGVKNAIKNLSKIKNLPNMYGYKVDIKNYFNSIDMNTLLNDLSNDIKDKKLFNLINALYSSKEVMYNNEVIEEAKGVMAGTPLSAFLANYYLKEIDNYFWKEKIVYARYADDIIMFCNDLESIDKYKKILYEYLKNNGLKINKSKEYFFYPGDNFEFLGFSFNGNEIDLSLNTINKIKGKIKRTAKGIRRWMIKNNAKSVVALKAMNRKYNRKFFGNDYNNELSWKFWFFPTITTSKSLKIIDNYMQDNLRYIVTGKHNKKNYEIVPYELLKSSNYKSLVNEYYKG